MNFFHATLEPLSGIYTMIGMRIAFAGGGTGGHVFPVQSLIKYINKHYHAKHEFLWFGENPSLEYVTCTYLQASTPKLRFISIISGKRRREKGLIAFCKNIRGLITLKFGTRQSLRYLSRAKVDVVFCKGGYVSLPVVVAAYLLRKPIFLHESDTKPGLANRICSKFATTIFTGFPHVFPGKEIVVGQILDDDLLPNHMSNHHEPIHDNKITHILITGGSQGAQSLYEPLAKILHHHKRDLTHFHVVLGTKNKDMAEQFSGLSNVSCYDFVSQPQMGELLLKCDVAITRGGTTSLAEQDLFAIKKIIVPIPWTHDQLKNAHYYVEHANDILVRQDKHGYENHLLEAITSLIHHKKHISLDSISDNITEPKKKIVSMLLKNA